MAHADRERKILSDGQVENLFLAKQHAKNIGCPLNHFMTIRLEKCEGEAGKSGTAQARLAPVLERARHWFVRRGHQLTAIWVAEKGELFGGLHVHVHLHIPSKPRRLRRDFVAMMGEWTGVGLDPVNRRNCHVIGQAEVEWPGESTAWEVECCYGEEKGERRVQNYMLKSRSRWHGSRIVGKRCGFSNNLGPAARARPLSTHSMPPRTPPKRHERPLGSISGKNRLRRHTAPTGL